MKFDIVGFVCHAGWPRYARPNPLFSLYFEQQWESIFRCRWPHEHFKTKLLAAVPFEEIRKRLTLRSKHFKDSTS